MSHVPIDAMNPLLSFLSPVLAGCVLAGYAATNSVTILTDHDRAAQ